MDGNTFSLDNPPIIEAVVDIECSMPSNFDLAATKAVAGRAYGDAYPNAHVQHLDDFAVVGKQGEKPDLKSSRRIGAYRFESKDGRQLVQVRQNGFSFNRLTPYDRFDHYLPEIRRTWDIFVSVVEPIRVEWIRLRFINRILIPLNRGRIELEDYLRIGPRLPGDNLDFTGFITQGLAVERETGLTTQTIIATQPEEEGQLPIIFDISVTGHSEIEPGDWDGIAAKIADLRRLKNQIFWDTLTERCLNQYQQRE